LERKPSETSIARESGIELPRRPHDDADDRRGRRMLLVVPLVSLALLMFVTLLMTRLELQRERGKLRAEGDIVAAQPSSSPSTKIGLTT